MGKNKENSVNQVKYARSHKSSRNFDKVVVMRFDGSKFWLWFWIILCWPIAIGYYVTHKKPVREKVKDNE